MLFYTSNEDEDAPEATIHNTDTGITYTLGLEYLPNEGRIPIVRMRVPGEAPLVLPRRLFAGAQAVEFWRALLYCNPWNGASVAPRVFLDRVAGVVQETVPDNGMPF